MKTRIRISPGQWLPVLAGVALLLASPAVALDLLVYNNSGAILAGSLPQAIQDNNALDGGNTIIFSSMVTGSITLVSEMVIGTNVTILGPGPDVLTVNGNTSNRVFKVSGGTVTISGLTIANGYVESDMGGGIYNLGTLHLSNCLFMANYGARGGGALSSSVDVTVNRCGFINNSTRGSGGGLLVSNLAILNNSAIVSNVAFPQAAGGGIFSYGGLTVSGCTIAGNAAGHGGGLAGPATVRNTIIAGNISLLAIDEIDVFGAFISGGYNLIGATNGSSGWGAVGDQFGTFATPIDPNLMPLGLYGGPTPTMPPQPGSPAIDQGKSFGLTTDQRGRARPFTNAVPPATLGDHSDIGAVELNYFPSIMVTNTHDRGDGSLRQAIAEVSSNGVITFAAGVTGTIALVSGEIDAFHTGFALLGPGAKALTVSGNNSGRVFSLFDGTFNISGLTLANGMNTGQSLGRAGNLAISFPTAVSLQQCRITGGRSLEGAGIWNAGTLTLSACTLDNNFATNYGGGIFNYSLGSLIMTNCTVATNAAPYDGGLYSEGTAVVRNCTFAFNSASVNAGGVVSAGSSFDLAGSLIASNTAPGAPDVYGPFISGGYNLIGNTSSSTGFGATGDQLNVNPLLGPLADYGGPTPTVALRSGSPAIDKGKSFGMGVDQRALPRPLDDPSISNASGGDGADIGAFEVDPNFRIVELRRPGSDVALSLMTVLGRNYRGEYTNNLGSGTWTIFTNNAPGNGYLLWVTNSGGANQPRRFYRGVVLP